VQGYAPRGMDVDSNGVVWTVLSSGHYASFDRRKCKGPLNGPTATGQHCPEGWTLHAMPGPNYKGAVQSGSAESAYYNFIDRFDVLGLGRNVPLADIARWFGRLAPDAIVEFVPKEDPMVRFLLSSREDVFADYTIEGFRAAMGTVFETVSETPLAESPRTMFHLRRR